MAGFNRPRMLQLQAISRSYRAGAAGCAASVRILDGVCLTVSAGQVVLIRGQHGAGKSTLLRCVAGLQSADSGERRLSSTGPGRVQYWPAPHDWRRAGMRSGDATRALHLFDDPLVDGFPGARAEFSAVVKRIAVARHALIIATSASVRDWAHLLPAGARGYELERGRLRAIAVETRSPRSAPLRARAEPVMQVALTP